MAELDTSGGGGKKGGKVRSKKQSTRVDLTAMVDLAFLLVTFFMLTTTLNKPKAMDSAMPDKDDKQTQEPIAASRTMTVLLGSGNKLEWFVGEPGKTPPTVGDYSKGDKGIRKVLIDQSQKVKSTTGKDMFVIVKPSEKSVYKNVVDVLDELHITNNMLFAIVDISPVEVDLLKRDNLF